MGIFPHPCIQIVEIAPNPINLDHISAIFEREETGQR